MNLPGSMNEHVVGCLMKDMLRRAMVEVHKQRFAFEVAEKLSTVEGKRAFVSTADTAAQHIYVKLLRERFPGYGIVAEEEDLSEPCTIPGEDVWFTVDPLDGTNAYIWRQSHGIGSMISLVKDWQVIAANVGDVMTNETYGYRPDGEHVWRISGDEHWEPLAIDPARSLAEQYVLLRDMPDAHSPAVQQIVKSQQRGGLFANAEVTGGSIGVSMARLWKGEVGAAILRPGEQTPWDTCPVLGICKKMGFVFYELRSRLNRGGVSLVPCELKPLKVTYRTGYDIMVVHKSRLDEVCKWCTASEPEIAE